MDCIDTIRFNVVNNNIANKVMKRLKATKKKLNTFKDEIDAQSRDIIISIFTQQNENDRLEYSKSRWRTNKKQDKINRAQKNDLTIQRPILTILPVLKYITKGVDIDICNFLIVEDATLHVIHKQGEIKFVKSKFQASKLKYWLSHLYFSRMKTKLALDLLLKAQNTARDTVHLYQQKQYMPNVLTGPVNNHVPLIRKIKVSPDARFRKQGQSQNKPYCVLYTKNGVQQILSFSDVLSYADYPFNLADILYFRILCPLLQGSVPILISYCKNQQKQFQKDLIQKFQTVLSRLEGWQFVKNQIQQLKMQAMKDNQYQRYARIATLQMVAYIERRHFLHVRKIQIQWIIDTTKTIRLSNVWIFDTSQANFHQITQGLETLYKKFKGQLTSLLPQNPLKRQTSTRYKRIKSEQKSKISNDWLPLPIVSNAKQLHSAKSSDAKHLSKFRKKGKSCVLRSGLALFS